MKIACYTPNRDRHWFLRNCVLQMKAQSRRPDLHYILLNGAGSENYDLRTIRDLLDEKIILNVFPQNYNTAQLGAFCIKALLEKNVDLFIKVDSDDMYYSYYVETALNCFEGVTETQGYCTNLIEQLWVEMDAGGNACIQEMNFHEGLGLSQYDKERGVKMGAPPTFVFNRPIAELIDAKAGEARYSEIIYDDILFREILIDNGVVIQQVRTAEPVFGYLKHSSNSSASHDNA